MGYRTHINRPYGIFQQVNVMASFMAMGLVTALYLWQQSSLSNRIRQLAGLVLIMAPCLLILIGSRIGLLAGVLITPVQIWCLLRTNRQSGIVASMLIAVGVAVAMFNLTMNGGGRPLAQLIDIYDRLVTWDISLHMFALKPFTGWGYGQFHSGFVHLLHQFYPALSEDYHVQHPHNEVLLWGVEGGLLALVGIVMMGLGFMCSLCASLRPGAPKFWLRVCQGPWLLPLPILMHMMVEFPLYQSATHGITLLVLLRVCEKRRRISMRINLLPYRLFLFWLARILLFYMIVGLWTSHKLVRFEQQGFQNLHMIDHITLPGPLQSRLEFDRQLGRLMQYPGKLDPQILTDYREWAEQYVLVRPDAGVYKNLMVIAQLQEDDDNYRYWQAQGHYLFPGNDIFN